MYRALIAFALFVFAALDASGQSATPSPTPTPGPIVVTTATQHTVSGNLTGVVGVGPSDVVQARFNLVNCMGGAPTVPGAVAVKSTTVLTADPSTLNISGTIWGNEAIQCRGAAATLYQLTYLRNNIPAAQPLYYRITADFDPQTASPVTVAPPRYPLAGGLSCPNPQVMVGVLADFTPVCQYVAASGALVGLGPPAANTCPGSGASTNPSYLQTDAAGGAYKWDCFAGTWHQQTAVIPPGVPGGFDVPQVISHEGSYVNYSPDQADSQPNNLGIFTPNAQLRRSLRLQARATYRTGFEDSEAANITSYIEHGWRADTIKNMNAAALALRVQTNTDVQIGGALSITIQHAGKNDGVALGMDDWCTGVNVGYAEGCEPFRVNAGFRGSNWGVIIESLYTDSSGQVSLQGTHNSSGTPIASTGHQLQLATENALVIDTNPAKIYAQGNITSIVTCPSGLVPGANPYICMTGDSSTNYSAKYGTTTMTTTTAAILGQNPDGSDPFANGPIPIDIPVASTAGCYPNTLFTISSTNDDFEMPTIISIGTGTIHALLNTHHDLGELVTCGGGIGHGIGMNVDDVPVGQWASGNEPNNNSIYRLATPVIATLPGNVIVTSNFPYNQGMNLGTRAFTATAYKQMPTITPVLTSGAISSWNAASIGDASLVLPAGTSWAGGIQPPLPTISFSGTCTTLPTAHLSLYQNNGHFFPITDTPGVGCTSLTATVNNPTPANPASIYPAGWSRSNKDVNYVETYPYGPKWQPDYNQVISKSTSGFQLFGGLLPCTSLDGFCTGDAVENVYNMHQLEESQINYTHKVMNIGTNGIVHTMKFSNHGNGDTEEGIVNVTPAAEYLGLAANHFSTDSTGRGGKTPPRAHITSGIHSVDYTADEPPITFGGAGGVFSEVSCDTSDMTAPCHNGVFPAYTVWQDRSQSSAPPLKWQVTPTTGDYQIDPDNYYPNAHWTARNLRASGQANNPGLATFDATGSPISTGLQVATQPTAPTGSCTTNAAWVFSADGHISFCSAGTWVQKL